MCTYIPCYFMQPSWTQCEVIFNSHKLPYRGCEILWHKNRHVNQELLLNGLNVSLLYIYGGTAIIIQSVYSLQLSQVHVCNIQDMGDNTTMSDDNMYYTIAIPVQPVPAVLPSPMKPNPH